MLTNRIVALSRVGHPTRVHDRLLDDHELVELLGEEPGGGEERLPERVGQARPQRPGTGRVHVDAVALPAAARGAVAFVDLDGDAGLA
ncbi:MAG: hypothetical protein ACRDZO_12485 [Egibacteraceae bacterium]